MGMKASSGFFSGTKGDMKYKLDIQHFSLRKDFKTLSKFTSNPQNFGKYKPISVYKWLKSTHKVQPLSKGSLKGISFNKGGGFKVVYDNDKLFQYHPKGKHHGLAYYKVSSGKGGTHRYYLNGKELKK